MAQHQLHAVAKKNLQYAAPRCEKDTCHEVTLTMTPYASLST
jgi:hypothetical protein